MSTDTKDIDPEIKQLLLSMGKDEAYAEYFILRVPKYYRFSRLLKKRFPDFFWFIDELTPGIRRDGVRIQGIYTKAVNEVGIRYGLSGRISFLGEDMEILDEQVIGAAEEIVNRIIETIERVN